MRDLGSVVVLLLLTAGLQANVTAFTDKSRVHKGEIVVLTLSIEGEDFRAPLIKNLCGTNLPRAEHRQKTEEIEGAFRKSDLYQFRFEARSDCVIEPILVEVDGVEHFTPLLRISVYSDNTQRDDEPMIALKSSKTDLYVGEPFALEVTLKKGGLHKKIIAQFMTPEMEHIWIKSASEVINTQEEKASVQKRRYLLVPQQAGEFHIYPAEVKIAYDENRDDGWGNLKTTRSWQSHYSNAIELYVKALPEGVTAVGDFTIEMKTETNEVEANRPLIAAITIQGRGNFEDISLPKHAVDGVDVFAEEPILEKIAENGEERWRQRLSFVSSHDYTIPSITFEYFDLQAQRSKRVETKAISIHVRDGQKAAKVYATRDKEKSEGLTMMWAIATYGLGFLSAAVLLLVPWRRYIKRREGIRLSQSDYKRLLNLLLGHKDDEGVKVMIEALEAYLYHGESKDIDQKALSKLLSKYGHLKR
jgi:hypothetical protein